MLIHLLINTERNVRNILSALGHGEPAWEKDLRRCLSISGEPNWWKDFDLDKATACNQTENTIYVNGLDKSVLEQMKCSKDYLGRWIDN